MKKDNIHRVSSTTLVDALASSSRAPSNTTTTATVRPSRYYGSSNHLHEEVSVPDVLSEAIEIGKKFATTDGEAVLLEPTRDVNGVEFYGKELNLEFVKSLKETMETARNDITTIRISNLRLGKDNFVNVETEFIATIVNAASSLISLTLSGCHLSDYTAVKIAESLDDDNNNNKLSKLQILDLSENKISDTGAGCFVKVLPKSNIHTLDLSNNRLTTQGVLTFCAALPLFGKLVCLHLADYQHLLPVSVFRQFAIAMEQNYTLQTLTMGSERLDGRCNSHTTRTAEKEMDALLGYWWQEPAYTAVTNRIRFFLRLNHAGFGNIITTNSNDKKESNNNKFLIDYINVLQSIQLTQAEQVEAYYRAIQFRPEIISMMVSSLAN